MLADISARQRGHALSRADVCYRTNNIQFADLLGILGVQQKQLADNGICCKIIHLQTPPVPAFLPWQSTRASRNKLQCSLWPAESPVGGDGRTPPRHPERQFAAAAVGQKDRLPCPAFCILLTGAVSAHAAHAGRTVPRAGVKPHLGAITGC